MVRHTLKILLQMLQVFYSVSDHFGRLCMKGLSKYDLSVDTRNSWVKKKALDLCKTIVRCSQILSDKVKENTNVELNLIKPAGLLKLNIWHSRIP